MTASQPTADGRKSQRPSMQVDELAEIIRTYRGVEEDDKDGPEGPWCDTRKFDIVMCIIILLNIFVISLEMDLQDDAQSGYDRDAVWIFLRVGLLPHLHG
jgi:hypothetical protein